MKKRENTTLYKDNRVLDSGKKVLNAEVFTQKRQLGRAITLRRAKEEREGE